MTDAVDGDRATFEQLTSPPADAPTLIEGLPGHGLVAAIAVDSVTNQLDLAHFGSISSEEFPPVVTFQDGLIQDLVRVYAGSDPDVLTLKSDLALPPPAFEPLTACVLSELATEFRRAIFIAGAPAASRREIGDVVGVATTESLKEELTATDIPVHEDPGLVGGVTGALVRGCYHAKIPVALLIVRSHPFLPDPTAAKNVIEKALEPLVDFDIDTTELDEQAGEIQTRMEQIAEQYRHVTEAELDDQRHPSTGMFQ